MSNEPPLDAADAALLDQAVRGLRDDLPDDARMRKLERLVAPVLVAPPAAAPWWQRGGPRAVAGAMLVLALGSARMVTRGGSDAPASSRAPSAPAPTVTRVPDDHPASLPAPVAMPPVSVDSLPAAPPAPAPAPLAREAKAPRAQAPAPAEGAEDPGDELALLEDARRALAADPARTLALADTHAQRFAKPALAQERERLAIDALVRLDRRPEAEARAKAFEATYPQSAHLARVRALVAPRVEP